MKTMFEMIEESSIKNPNSPALSASGKTITHKQLWEGIRNTAGNLRNYGVVPGDRFLFSVRPNIDGIIFALGVVATGAAVVFADPGDSVKLLEKRLQMIQPKFSAAEPLLYSLAANKFLSKIAQDRGLSLPRYKDFDNMGFFHSGTKTLGTPKGSVSIQKLALTPNVLPDDVSGNEDGVIVFTSGTTDNP